jgi:hypothetical protein
MPVSTLNIRIAVRSRLPKVSMLQRNVVSSSRNTPTSKITSPQRDSTISGSASVQFIIAASIIAPP